MIVRPLAVLIAVFVPMLIEARRAARNERAQHARGGIEPAGDVYPLMQVAYPGAFLAMLVEGALRSPSMTIVAAGAAVFAAAKALKWWAIAALGPAWTFRIVVVPGARRIESGPYRFLRHPNYVGVIGELAGVGLMTGAVVSAPAAIVIFGALILKRMAVEERAWSVLRTRTGPSDEG